MVNSFSVCLKKAPLYLLNSFAFWSKKLLVMVNSFAACLKKAPLKVFRLKLFSKIFIKIICRHMMEVLETRTFWSDVQKSFF